ncbi:UNVERIFIED_CONTAM: hypothetical protein H355_015132, partial [Colinus virginianus]
NKIPSEMGSVLNTLLDVVSSISSLLDKVQHVMENLPVFLQAIQNIGVFDIAALQQNKIPSEMGSVLNTLLDVVSSISSLLDKVQHVMENLPVFLQAIQNIGVFDIAALQQFLQGGRFRSSSVGSLESVMKAICREESSFFSNANLFVDMPRITGHLEDNMAKYGIPEDSTPFCLKLYQEILQSSNGALIWAFLKPLLHGKILYNSNINMIDLVIEKANFTFGFVESLKTYSQTWLRMSEVFKNRGNVLTVSRLQEALQNNFVKHFVESNLDIDLEQLFQKMQVYEIMMAKTLNSSASRQIDLLSQLIVNISSCVLLDRFQPFESVDKLEEKAHELMQQNNFLASIIFNTSKNKTPDSSNRLTQHVSYTIRTSVLYSMRTDLIKNPAWKSHPQKLPSDGFKYNHIFIPLQDMIERAIISAQTGLDVSEPAIQVQAMPYPCHTSDLMVRKLVYERQIHFEECLLSTTAFGQGVFFITFFEGQEIGCTLIFTTHHLDEAEVLSDRIAILQQGQLRCYGSPSYLRETYGQGHSLTLIKKPTVFEIQDPKHVFRVTSLVQSHIPEAFLKENSGTELTYVIPERADKTSFKGLFQALDQSLHHLHVTGYGISDTTLEE